MILAAFSFGHASLVAFSRSALRQTDPAMSRPLNLLLPIAIALAAAGGIVARNAMSISDDADVTRQIDLKRSLAEPFALRGAWRDIGGPFQTPPALSGDDAEASPETKPSLTVEGSAVHVAESDARDYRLGERRGEDSSLGKWAADRQDIRTILSKGPGSLPMVAASKQPTLREEPSQNEVTEGFAAAAGAAERDGLARDDQPEQSAKVVDTATSAIPERGPHRPVSLANGASRTLSATPPRKSMQPVRRGANRPVHADPINPHLDASLFRDMHYATP